MLIVLESDMSATDENDDMVSVIRSNASESECRKSETCIEIPPSDSLNTEVLYNDSVKSLNQEHHMVSPEPSEESLFKVTIDLIKYGVNHIAKRIGFGGGMAQQNDDDAMVQVVNNDIPRVVISRAHGGIHVDSDGFTGCRKSVKISENSSHFLDCIRNTRKSSRCSMLNDEMSSRKISTCTIFSLNNSDDSNNCTVIEFNDEIEIPRTRRSSGNDLSSVSYSRELHKMSTSGLPHKGSILVSSFDDSDIGNIDQDIIHKYVLNGQSASDEVVCSAQINKENVVKNTLDSRRTKHHNDITSSVLHRDFRNVFEEKSARSIHHSQEFTEYTTDEREENRTSGGRGMRQRALSDSALYQRNRRNEREGETWGDSRENKRVRRQTEIHGVGGSNVVLPSNLKQTGRMVISHPVFVVKKREGDNMYRKISDTDMMRTQKEEHYVYEFPASEYETSEIITFVKNMQLRRNGMTDEIPNETYDEFMDYLLEQVLDEWFY